MVGRFNFGGSSSGNLFPIYQQMNEPVKKEGIWIKTNEKIKEIYFANEDMDSIKTLTLCDRFVVDDAVTFKDNEFYYKYESKLYKYDTLNNLITDLNVEIPDSIKYLLFRYTGELYGTTGNNLRDGIIYKIDINAGNYSKVYDTDFLIKAPIIVGDKLYYIIYDGFYFFDFKAGRATKVSISIDSNHYNYYDSLLIGTDIFISTLPNTEKYNFSLVKYNTLNGTYAEIDTPISANRGGYFTAPKISSIGTDIYLFGGRSSSSSNNFNWNMKVYKYDTLTDTFTLLGEISEKADYDFSKAIALRNDFYLFNLHENVNYKYNLYPNLPKGIYMFMKMKADKNINGYLVNELYKYIYAIEIFNEEEKLENEIYIGDGTSWNLLGGN